MPKTVTLNHIGLLNFDEKQALKFYREILGFNEQYRFSLSANEAEKIFTIRQNLQVIVFIKDDVKFEIFIPQETIPFIPAVNHVCLNVAERSSIVARCKENGLKVTEIRRPDRVTVFVNDFAGNVFELKELD